ncbi:hypothetical protein SprV_0902742700 [Sparganum proliferum]
MALKTISTTWDSNRTLISGSGLPLRSPRAPVNDEFRQPRGAQSLDLEVQRQLSGQKRLKNQLALVRTSRTLEDCTVGSPYAFVQLAFPLSPLAHCGADVLLFAAR